jgi:hypothetical protein
MHLLGYFKNEKDLSIWQPKAEKKQEEEEKRKHDSGKLSDGYKIDNDNYMTNKCFCC